MKDDGDDQIDDIFEDLMVGHNFEYAAKAIKQLFKTHTANAALDAQISGMQQAKSRVLRRTEIPKDARNPTRDTIVIIGEQIADIIQRDIDALKQGPTNAK